MKLGSVLGLLALSLGGCLTEASPTPASDAGASNSQLDGTTDALPDGFQCCDITEFADSCQAIMPGGSPQADGKCYPVGNLLGASFVKIVKDANGCRMWEIDWSVGTCP